MNEERERVEEFPWATFLVTLLCLTALIAGAAVVIFDDDVGALNFKEYLKYLGPFAIAAGLLGIGRGIRSHGWWRDRVVDRR